MCEYIHDGFICIMMYSYHTSVETEMYFIHMVMNRRRHHQSSAGQPQPQEQRRRVERPSQYLATGPERTAAAIQLQRAYRRRQARRQMRFLIHNLHQSRVDPETGLRYFINTATGEESWEQPALMKKFSDPEQVLESTTMTTTMPCGYEDPEDWQEVIDGYGQTVRRSITSIQIYSHEYIEIN